ncbi:ankyrin repeat domain-containing protein [Paenibacillus hodogayensis]|uniref:Ankyrin repeat domain-containing protein n=1 Tax=Paenibacillus hodogayensis TaxID=279208 RepID=A0ABV5W6C9_9BACL
MAFEFEDLSEAAEVGDFKQVKKILNANPELIKGKDEYEFSILHGAVMTENVKMIDYLIDQGAEVNARNDEGITPLHLALDPQVAARLLDRGALIDAASDDGSTPLHTQVSDGEERLDVVELLLTRGANREAKNRKGHTPLEIALQREDEEMAAQLRK